ncbi:hypothetical protein DY000_02058794 [Brassica cretica]|uniref:Uncharacterized protein n=1 Tax=Brassica cretica TaxID=69181 RepID=A0ABQ7ANV1_BRACR|nr:hypothetical protein DY000_02058794 [Brassica cretica]
MASHSNGSYTTSPKTPRTDRYRLQGHGPPTNRRQTLDQAGHLPNPHRTLARNGLNHHYSLTNKPLKLHRKVKLHHHTRSSELMRCWDVSFYHERSTTMMINDCTAEPPQLLSLRENRRAVI